MTVSSVVNTYNQSVDKSASTANSNDPAAMQDRFLKLLVAQLSNQDPMNPMDNAQMTTQIAQINTVSGIQQLNSTMNGLSDRMTYLFASLQVMQGSSMVGRQVLVEGNTVYRDGAKGLGSFDLGETATKAKVEIVTPGGQVIGTVDMGKLDKGRHNFEYDVGTSYTGELKFRVIASNDAGTVEATTLQRDKVVSAGAVDGVLTLQLEKGKSVGYEKVRALL
jgi:flagellar basal-body rod modification protein FlgD